MEPLPKPWPGTMPIFRIPALQGSAEWRENSPQSVVGWTRRGLLNETGRGEAVMREILKRRKEAIEKRQKLCIFQGCNII